VKLLHIIPGTRPALIASILVLILSSPAPASAADSKLNQEFDAVNKQFDQAFEKHQLELSERLARQMILLKPKNTRGYKNLAYVQEAKRDYKTAADTVSEALKFGSDRAKCLAIRGRIYAENDQDNLARADYTDAIKIDNQDASTYSSEAFGLERLDDYEGAYIGIQKALKHGAKDGRSYKIAGRVAQHLNLPHEAITYFLKAQELLPGESESLRDLAELHTTLKQYDNVIADATAAINIADVRGMQMVGVYRLRGQAYGRLGHYKEALADYDACIKISPLQHRLFQERADIKRKMGDTAGADQDLAKMKSIDGSIQPFNGF
jgi:tetratricopeptide (TPR) repeat protein